jgi:hypothetical protein
VAGIAEKSSKVRDFFPPHISPLILKNVRIEAGCGKFFATVSFLLKITMRKKIILRMAE